MIIDVPARARACAARRVPSFADARRVTHAGGALGSHTDEISRSCSHDGDESRARPTRV